MTYRADIIADSVSGTTRVTTMQLCYPRFIHAQILMYRLFVRNARSSRAVPVKRMIQNVIDDPVRPIFWGRNKSGMVADTELADTEAVKNRWDVDRESTIATAEFFASSKLHKQIANRILEPHAHIYTVLSATNVYDVPDGHIKVTTYPWQHFFAQRCADDAQPEIQALAQAMRAAYEASIPKETQQHLPYVLDAEQNRYTVDSLLRISAMRCARVSYHPPDSVTPDAERDLEKIEQLITAGHSSPLEHPAIAGSSDHMYGAYKGWRSLRMFA